LQAALTERSAVSQRVWEGIVSVCVPVTSQVFPPISGNVRRTCTVWLRAMASQYRPPPWPRLPVSFFFVFLVSSNCNFKSVVN